MYSPADGIRDYQPIAQYSLTKKENEMLVSKATVLHRQWEENLHSKISSFFRYETKHNLPLPNGSFEWKIRSKINIKSHAINETPTRTPNLILGIK